MTPMLRDSKNVLSTVPDRAAAAGETSDEHFDRAAFARRALDLLRPNKTTVAICEGATRMRVECGRVWGRPGEAWALLAIPDGASRLAIALAVAELVPLAPPYAFDALFEAANGPPR